jgi:folate-dependent phosphoribosylglycinamide formyltransferase PurN
MTAHHQPDADPYRVVLLTKAGVGASKQAVLDRLAAADGITVSGVVVEDLLHGSPLEYTRTLLANLLRRRGRGYPVRIFNAARDIVGTLRGLVPELRPDERPTGQDRGRHNIPTIAVSDIRSSHAAGQLRALDPDLAIVWGTRILPPEIFDIPRDGSIGVHAGKIPEYRGGPAGFWELYNGEQTVGVTVQQLNDELDAGQILAQETVPVRSDDRLADIRKRQEALTPDLVVQTVQGLADGSLEPREWDGTKGTVNTPPTLIQLLRFKLRRRSQRR